MSSPTERADNLLKRIYKPTSPTEDREERDANLPKGEDRAFRRRIASQYLKLRRRKL